MNRAESIAFVNLMKRVEAAEAKVARCQAILDAWMAWDGSQGPDGRGHPDASSPRDRERLREALHGPQSATGAADGALGRSDQEGGL